MISRIKRPIRRNLCAARDRRAVIRKGRGRRTRTHLPEDAARWTAHSASYWRTEVPLPQGRLVAEILRHPLGAGYTMLIDRTGAEDASPGPPGAGRSATAGTLGAAQSWCEDQFRQLV